MKAEDIKVLMIKTGVPHKVLAERLGMSSQNLTNKLKRDDLKQSELFAIAKACGVSYKSYFELEDGTKI